MLYLSQLYCTYLCFQTLTSQKYSPSTVRSCFIVGAATVIDPLFDWLPLWSYGRSAAMLYLLIQECGQLG